MMANAIRCPLWILAMAVGLLTLGIPRSSAGQCPIQLHEVSEETGIYFSPHRREQRSPVHRGNRDGRAGPVRLRRRRPDRHLLPERCAAAGHADTETPRNALYRNEGNWKFRDVTEQAGVGDTGFGLGVAVADYDSDGDPDIYVNNFGPNVLYHNNGDGTFSDVDCDRPVSRRATRWGPAPRFSTSTPMAISTCTSAN